MAIVKHYIPTSYIKKPTTRSWGKDVNLLTLIQALIDNGDLVISAGVDNITADNGLARILDEITIGGTLIENTTIDGDNGTYSFTLEAMDGITLEDISNGVSVTGTSILATGATLVTILSFSQAGISASNLGNIGSILCTTGTGGTVEIESTNNVDINAVDININASGITSIVLDTYADNAAALIGGLVATNLYKTVTGEVRVVV